MKVLAITTANLIRLFRQPANIFFVFVFPMLLIIVIGITFGGEEAPTMGIVAPERGPLGDELIDHLEAALDNEVAEYENQAALLEAVERGNVPAGLVLPEGYDALVRSGEDVRLEFLASPGRFGQQLLPTIQAAVAEQSLTVRVARSAEAGGLASFDTALATAVSLQTLVPEIGVETTTAGEALFPETLGEFDIGASSQLILFVFFTSLTGSAALIETRRLGVSRRMLSTPTSAGTILAGEGLGRFAVAMVQGLFIMLGSRLVFGVNWGDPLGAAVLLTMFALVGTGAGMLMGALFENDQQASSLGILLGLGLAALGGAMLPLEFYNPTMKTVAHFTPHAWALDGFAELVRRGGTLVDILPELAVLAGYATVLLVVASWGLRKRIVA